jgi:hypothetical protein
MDVGSQVPASQNKMAHITPELVDQAVNRGILTRAQGDELWRFLAEAAPAEAAPQKASASRFSFTNVLYYFGGMLAIGAMTLFMTLGWQAFGGWGIFAIAAAYCAIALAGSSYLLRKGLPTPAGILSALAVALVPLAIYGLQIALNQWPDTRPYRDYHYLIDWRWAVMELATLAAGSIILFLYRLPFAVMPLAVTLWYMSMDFAPLLAGGEDATWKYREAVSMVFGLLMIALAAYVDFRSRRKPDFGFWLYLFGTAAFWGALSMQDSNSQFAKFLYACLNAAMVFAGAILARRVFTVFGGLGLFGYLGYLSYSVFKDSLLFPLALTALGLALVGVGVWWQRHEEEISRKFRRMLPAALRETLEEAA